MKKIMMLTAVLTAVLTLTGCCTKTCPAKGESCPKQKKCDMPCARKTAGISFFSEDARSFRVMVCSLIATKGLYV